MIIRVDFSGRVDNPDRHGYRAEPSDYEMSVIEREPETLLQRYQRLKQEVAELATDVENVRQSQESSEKLLQVSPADLLQDVRGERTREREDEREREREGGGGGGGRERRREREREGGNVNTVG